LFRNGKLIYFICTLNKTVFFNFNNKQSSLIKNANDRADHNMLLNEPFIKKYEREKMDLEFLREIIDEIKKDKVEG